MKRMNTVGNFGIGRISKWDAHLKILATISVALFFTPAAQAVQFSVLDPGYSQEIFTTPLSLGGEAGMAWTTGGNLLTRNGSSIIEYNLNQNTSHQGTNVHGPLNTHPIAGLNTSGYGMTEGFDGFIYTPTSAGLQRFDPNNWAAPAQSLAGTIGGAGYGITTLSDGRIAYSDGSGASNVYVYNPSGGTNTLIYSATFLIDDIKSGPGGLIALAGQGNSSISVINSSGGLVNFFFTTHFPDGMAFGDGLASTSIFSNNNDGSISKYDLGPGYTSPPITTIIASQPLNNRAYGDLAAVGPDCAFYVTQFPNDYHGSTAGVGTHWDNGTTNSEASIVRISALGLDGLPTCGFYTPHDVPEPGSLLLLLAGVMAFIVRFGWSRFRFR
jgi:hypothetical protein